MQYFIPETRETDYFNIRYQELQFLQKMHTLR